jgi:hypothetical protein
MANLVARVVTSFPSQAQGSNGLKITQSNGIFTVQPDYMSVVQAGALVNQSQVLVLVYRGDLSPAQYQTYNLTQLSQSLQAALVSPNKLQASPWVINATDTFVVVENSSAAPISIQMPASSAKVGAVEIKDGLGNFAAYNVTILPSAGEKIDGASSFVMRNNFQSLKFVPFTGIGYYISG